MATKNGPSGPPEAVFRQFVPVGPRVLAQGPLRQNLRPNVPPPAAGSSLVAPKGTGTAPAGRDRLRKVRKPKELGPPPPALPSKAPQGWSTPERRSVSSTSRSNGAEVGA